jgi:hypothetical protein
MAQTAAGRALSNRDTAGCLKQDVCSKRSAIETGVPDPVGHEMRSVVDPGETWLAAQRELLFLAEAGLRIPRGLTAPTSVRNRASLRPGPGEPARLSVGCCVLLGRRDDVGRREEPSRYESGFRAHGSNQRFHRLLRHAVARALTTAPSLAGVSPAAQTFSVLTGGGARAARHAIAQRKALVRK